VPQRRQRLQEILHVGPAGAVEVLVPTAVGIDGEEFVRVGHGGMDGLCAGLGVTGPVKEFRRL